MTMPGGLRFCPLDHEVLEILKDKAWGDSHPAIQDIDFYSLSPDQLSLEKSRHGKEAYFFTYLHRKDADSKPDRSTSDGYWEEIGGDVAITYKKKAISRYGRHVVITPEIPIPGYKSTFVFHYFSADDGKDNFYMEEFRLDPSLSSEDPNIRNNIKNLVVCKIESMFPNHFLIPEVEWVEGANECSDDEVEEEKISPSLESV